MNQPLNLEAGQPAITVELANPAKRRMHRWCIGCFVALLFTGGAAGLLVSGVAQSWDSKNGIVSIDVSESMLTYEGNLVADEAKGLYTQVPGKNQGRYWQRTDGKVTLQSQPQSNATGMCTWVFLDDTDTPLSDATGELVSAPCKEAAYPGKDCDFDYHQDFFSYGRVFLYASPSQTLFVTALLALIFGIVVVIVSMIFTADLATKNRQWQALQKAVEQNWADPARVLLLPITAERAASFLEGSHGANGARRRLAWKQCWADYVVVGPVCGLLVLVKAYLRYDSWDFNGNAWWQAVAVGYAAGVAVMTVGRLCIFNQSRARMARYRDHHGPQSVVLFHQADGGAAFFYREEGCLARSQTTGGCASCCQSASLQSSIQQRADGWVLSCKVLNSKGDVPWFDFNSEEFPLETGQKDQVVAWCAGASNMDKKRILGFTR